ncbi:MAG TPA: DUF4870 domain-containing protein [Lacibacter sp.]|nr:DUF4870 domain-containing protein [Lacibacter sp.]HMO89091.1 DUF4870 domain-containing protein [Lacibacter sp.]HMP87258.1 DUF4870 domain-containing protein [Lacibacter sp.]
MITIQPYRETPGDHEKEKASNSYLMSLVAVIAGLPLPIINLLATLFFYLGNRRSTHFVRWHCTQALLSQFTLLLMNAAGFSWTMTILFTPATISNLYIGYILTVVLFNLTDFIATMYSAIQVRKGRHVYWWFYGPLTDRTCKP